MGKGSSLAIQALRTPWVGPPRHEGWIVWAPARVPTLPGGHAATGAAESLKAVRGTRTLSENRDGAGTATLLTSIGPTWVHDACT